MCAAFSVLGKAAIDGNSDSAARGLRSVRERALLAAEDLRHQQRRADREARAAEAAAEGSVVSAPARIATV